MPPLLRQLTRSTHPSFHCAAVQLRSWRWAGPLLHRLGSFRSSLGFSFRTHDCQEQPSHVPWFCCGTWNVEQTAVYHATEPGYGQFLDLDEAEKTGFINPPPMEGSLAAYVALAQNHGVGGPTTLPSKRCSFSASQLENRHRQARPVHWAPSSCFRHIKLCVWRNSGHVCLLTAHCPSSPLWVTRTRRLVYNYRSDRRLLSHSDSPRSNGRKCGSVIQRRQTDWRLTTPVRETFLARGDARIIWRSIY